MPKMYKPIAITIISLILAAILIPAAVYTPLMKSINWKIYDALVKSEYELGCRATPAVDDILLVTIDNDTLNNMEERWPYSRATFAGVIDNLNNAGCKMIGFDFIFHGRSTDEEDALLKKALERRGGVVLGSSIDAEGVLNASTTPALKESAVSGFVTKVEDPDGVTRRSLTYLIGDKDPNKGVLSWEMELLRAVKDLDLATISNRGSAISFENGKGEKWVIPVERGTGSFLIRFHSHTSDFKRLSFYKVLKGDFDPSDVKDKIVLIGLSSQLFQDLHNTPLGWLPGITLNANAFVTLSSRDFLREAPKSAEIVLLIIGVIAAAVFVSLFGRRMALILIFTEIVLFLAISLLLIMHGWVWNYAVFPILVMVCPILGKKMYTFIAAKYWWTFRI